MKPAERAMLDQSIEQVAQVLAIFGVDRRDPVAMRGALGAVQALACIFEDSAGMDRDDILRGFLFNLAEMQP